MLGILSWRVRHPPAVGCSTARCDCGAPAGGDERASSYSAILNWKSASGFNLLCEFPRDALVSRLLYHSAPVCAIATFLNASHTTRLRD